MPADRRGRDRALFAGWVLFVACTQLVLLVEPRLETVAFHLVWISMSIVYGFQSWSARRTAAVLTTVTLVTGGTMAAYAWHGHLGWDELAEVPLMALVFLAMAWHVRRRAAALAELRAAAERERRAQQDKELFVRTCSHEMRTPLTVARCYAELVQGELPAGAGREDLDVVLDELDRLARLSGRLLVLADAYHPAEPEHGPVDLDALVHRTVQRWRPATDRHWHLDAPAVRIEGDESRLEAALDALVENAVKYTAPGDAITLRCRTARHGAELDVEDTGIGFAHAPATGLAGTGLGLAIVRAVLDAHAGELTISPAPHGGSLLRMRLPAPRPA
ncbi:sensor histidine kinase [Kitasatospora sp. NPDC059795]|uniref:sensor histidine kinase n=1 Tax=Kitasatospora sp. NPDC059795 TaxID=3346949 RepID=UPI00365BB738